MKIKAYNIAYDTDGEKVDLPNELIFDIEPNLDEVEIVEIIEDKISEKTNYCVLGFNWVEIK